MVVDWTYLNAFQQCPEKGHLRMELDLVPIAPNLALEFGKGIHISLDALHTFRSFEAALGRFSEYFGKYEGLDSKRTIGTASKLLFAYFELMKMEHWEDLPVEDSGVEEKKGELSFAIELSQEVVYKGVIDRPGRYNGDLAIKEFKTSSWPTNFISNPNGQITGYYFGASSLLGQVTTIIVDIFGVFQPPKSGKESSRQLLFRHLQRRTKDDWERFSKDVLDTVANIKRWWEQNYWPRYTDFCSSYGGCAYQALCMDGVSQQQREAIIQQMFREEHWTPGEPDRQKEY